MGPRLLHYSDLENAYDEPERVGRLAGLLRARDGADALVCGTGDNTSPGVLALVTRGAQSLALFEAVEPDFDTFGNHDFDYGPERLRELVAATPQQWLSANVREDGAPFAAEAGTTASAVREVDGERVGVLGLTTPMTPSINPNAGEPAFDEPVAAARPVVADLHERADHVVVLSHLGRGDETLAAELDVDVVLGGHVHAEVVERVHDTLLTRPGANGEVVLEVDLATRAVTRHEVADAACDEGVADALREEMAAADLDEVVASVDDPIERTEAAAFRGESRVGNFVADAYRWAGDADVGLQNSGGIRTGPPLAGPVTVGDLVSVIPFEEPCVVAEVTGERLRAAFTQAGGANLAFGEPEWWHAHVSGATITYDTASHELVAASVGGDPVEPDATYRLVTADYVLHSDDEFPALTRDCRVATLDTQYEILADYAREHGVDPELEGRIRHV